MANPKVSVLIPCYNLGRYLDEAVDSVFAQTLQDFEILIVNDGSTDPETNQLLSGYRRPKTRVIAGSHRGLAAARNLATAQARGDYLCALDADDRLAPTFLEKAGAVLDGDPDVTFVSAWLQAFGEEDWLWRQERCDLPALLAECTVLTCALVRRAAVVAVGGYDEGMPVQGDEDWDLWITLAERGHRGTILPEVLFHYRRRPGSMSRTCTEGETHLRLVRYLVDKHRESYERHLLEVLRHKATGAAALETAVAAAESDVATRLLPRVEARRRELTRLRAKLDAAPPPSPVGAWLETTECLLESERRRAEALEAALEAARHEARSLRESWSWRVTAPLRAAYGRLLRRQGRSTRRPPGPP